MRSRKRSSSRQRSRACSTRCSDSRAARQHGRLGQFSMLEIDDIQHILLARAPALTGRYEFLSFRDAAAGRAWLSGIKEKVHSVEAMRANVDRDKRWGTVALTWNGLAAAGLVEACSA